MFFPDCFRLNYSQSFKRTFDWNKTKDNFFLYLFLCSCSVFLLHGQSLWWPKHLLLFKAEKKNEKRKAGGEEESRSGSLDKSISSSARPPPTAPSGCCYRFHSRQEVDRHIASFPAPYRAVADCLFWKAFHPGRSQGSLVWVGVVGHTRERTCGGGFWPISVQQQLESSSSWCSWCVTNLPSWLLSMTSNCFLNHLRSKSRRTLKISC